MKVRFKVQVAIRYGRSIRAREAVESVPHHKVVGTIIDLADPLIGPPSNLFA